MMARKYLVTGGAGFLGAALVRRLVSLGHAVRVLDDGSRGTPRRLADIADRLDYVQGDIRDAETVAAATRGMDSVLHLAAVNGTEFFYSKPELVLSVGVRGMLNVIEACRRNDVGDLVVASSSEVYQTPPTVPTDEIRAARRSRPAQPALLLRRFEDHQRAVGDQRGPDRVRPRRHLPAS